ncbi:MAG TPA: aminomethyl-transferring glycine dehydrogenase subunit GcvPB [Vicinamibacterales bacterium]|nr:aminomethyl-transferring glycine dehydrogenase subunit GcvPB [Vicinamibacterales bacterium]
MTTPDRRDELVFNLTSPGRRGYSLPARDVPEAPLEGALPEGLAREAVEGFPELTEVGLVRHFTRLSTWNYGVDTGMYPLGSCTMKYNPKLNEAAARMPGFAALHPLTPDEASQGALGVMYALAQMLAEITGLPAVTLQPAAGAHGELTGMMMIRKHLITRDGSPRKLVLIPDSAHGTNPASAHFCGYQVREIKSSPRGTLSVSALAEAMTDEVAALMLTNPNTLGIFEEEICEVARIVHAKGGLVYCDGANMNALVGRARPGDFGMDIMHLNLHKTFSTPHGGGGPGSGPVVAIKALEPYLPTPVIVATPDGLRRDYDRPLSVGRVKAFQGNFGMVLRAYAYIRTLGPDGIRATADNAVLNANYLRVKLRDDYDVPYDRLNMHEVIFSDHHQNAHGVTTLDIAKRLIDYGFHPPTVYFPLIVHGALMVEPTESEGLEELDRFVEVMKRIAEEARTEPGLLKKAPVTTRRSRFDEAAAARKPVLRWKKE